MELATSVPLVSIASIIVQSSVLIALALYCLISSRAPKFSHGAVVQVPQTKALQTSRSQRRNTPQEQSSQEASDVEAAAADTHTESCNDSAEEGSSKQLQAQGLGLNAFEPDDNATVYSSSLLLAHRAISLRIACGPPGLELDPAVASRTAARTGLRALPASPHRRRVR